MREILKTGWGDEASVLECRWPKVSRQIVFVPPLAAFASTGFQSNQATGRSKEIQLTGSKKYRRKIREILSIEIGLKMTVFGIIT